MKRLFITIAESIVFAWDALVKNRLRTLLSLLGISIGIFCIVAVLSAVSSLKKNIDDDLRSMGGDVVYVGKWPWGIHMNIPWWEIQKRPHPIPSEAEALRRRMPQLSDRITISMTTTPQVKINSRRVNDAQMVAVDYQYENIEDLKINEGRFFSPIESVSGAAVAVIGYDIYDDFFSSPSDAIGKTLVYKGQKVKIIGTLEKEGEQTFGVDKDNRIFVPSLFYRKYNVINEKSGAEILIAPLEGNDIDMDELLSEIRGNMRVIRQLPPEEVDNFELNVPSVIATTFAPLYAMLNLAGWIIGGFSMLVGGFGIANIMFVSVRERTPQIGIQKSLGARNYFILLQFVFEAIFLSLIGGIVGIAMVWAALTGVNAISDSITFYLSGANIMIGITISAVIGFLSGIVPAYIGARLNPVDAIRSGQ